MPAAPMELALIGMALDGQPIQPPQGAVSDTIEADKTFADMEKQARWHPAVTKYFRVSCELETLYDFVSHFKGPDDWGQLAISTSTQNSRSARRRCFY